jgi:hypothetical protein
MVAVVLVAADLAGATNMAIDIRVGPFAPEESKKNEGGSCPTGRSPPPCNAARSQRWLLALLLELLLTLGLPMPPLLLPPPMLLLPLRCFCSDE